MTACKVGKIGTMLTSARTESGSDGWRTPPALLDLVERVLDVRLAVDAACTPQNRIRGAAKIEPWDGLAESWRSAIVRSDLGDGPLPAVWCNPPYSQVAKWIRKGRAAAASGVTSIFLVPARTGSRWWIDCHEGAHVVLLTGRVQFLRPIEDLDKPPGKGQSATFDSALVIFRPGFRSNPSEPREYLRWAWKKSGQLLPRPFVPQCSAGGWGTLNPWPRLPSTLERAARSSGAGGAEG